MRLTVFILKSNSLLWFIFLGFFLLCVVRAWKDNNCKMTSIKLFIARIVCHIFIDAIKPKHNAIALSNNLVKDELLDLKATIFMNVV